jgi:16S rRNA (guanine527-N7)-methyltransferase
VTDDTGLCLDRIGELYGLSGDQVGRLERILSVLESDEAAPTSVREPDRAVDVHIADSLVALELDVVRAAREMAEIGAGAGFPGLPLSVALPLAKVTLVDSQSRKCAFMERAKTEVGLENVAVVCARVEEWPEGTGAHDVVLARAVGPQPLVLEYAAPLLCMGGSLVDWRGQRDAGEEEAALVAAETLGLERRSIRKVEPFEGVRDHHLHVYTKIRETPDEFPRRAGTARKKPLARSATERFGDDQR